MGEINENGGPSVIDRNINALLEKRKKNEGQRTLQDRMADKVTAFTGSMTFVYLHLLIFSGWILANIGVLPVKPFDPSLVILAMAASVEAIFLSTFVLISQNRMQRLADERADLNLHISLLSEHEITQLVRLVSSMAAKVGIEESRDPGLSELKQDVLPEKVIEKMEQHDPD
jgi:uncharacterized membrane protein